jgi:hypothetical protein
MKIIFEKIWVRHFLIILGILIISQLGAEILRQKACKHAKVILEPRNSNFEIIQKGITALSTLYKVSLKKLQNLLNIIENRKKEKKLDIPMIPCQ